MLLPAVYTATTPRGWLHVSFECPEETEVCIQVICQTVCASSRTDSEKVVMTSCPESIIMQKRFGTFLAA